MIALARCMVTPSADPRTTLSGYIFATKVRINNRKKLLSSNIFPTCLYNMVNFGLLAAETVSLVWGTRVPSKRQRLSRLGFLAATSLTGGQPNFARCLAVSCAATLCIHFRRLLPADGISHHVKFTLRPSLAFSYIGSVTAALQQRASAKLRRGTRNGITELSQRAPPIFGWAAITLAIGPHSSYRLEGYRLLWGLVHMFFGYNFRKPVHM